MDLDRGAHPFRPDEKGGISAAGLRFALVVSRFNETVTSRLLEGALDAFRKYGAGEKNIEVVRVPGAFEIPVAAKKLALLGRFNAILCIGAVIRGETAHFDYICNEVSRGVMNIALETVSPVIFGVLTVDTPDQAMERAGLKSNKGSEGALAAIEMALLFKNLK